MAKITFKAELRIPRQVILPLPVANTAQVPRVLTLDNRKMEVHESIADHLEQRYPKWVEPEKEQEPSDEKPLEKMTIAELTALAESEGIDLGKAKLHADIVKVIADHQTSDEEDDESASDDKAEDDQDPDADGDEPEDQDADGQESPDSDA